MRPAALHCIASTRRRPASRPGLQTAKTLTACPAAGLTIQVPPAPAYVNIAHAPDGNATLLPADALPACPAELAV